LKNIKWIFQDRKILRWKKIIIIETGRKTIEKVIMFTVKIICIVRTFRRGDNLPSNKKIAPNKVPKTIKGMVRKLAFGDGRRTKPKRK
jgi:hypothetical protein